MPSQTTGPGVAALPAGSSATAAAPVTAARPVQPEGLSAAVGSVPVPAGSNATVAARPPLADRVAAPGRRAAAEGVTSTVVRVGVVSQGRLLSGDEFAPLLQAVAEDINRRGGVAGRRLELVIETADTQTPDQQAQTDGQVRACTRLTQDERVLMVINLTAYGRYALGCYVDAQMPYQTLGMGGLAEAELRRQAAWVLPTLQPHIERLARTLPPLLAQRSWMTQRVGIVALDLPEHVDTARRVLRPAIARVGGRVVEEAYLPVTHDLPAAAAGAVLRFKDADVDRVVMWLGGTGPWQFFAQAAEGQNYRPGYAITSQTIPFIAREGARVPEQQLRQALGIGWDPYIDGVHGPPTARERQCYDVVQAADRSRSARGAASACEHLWLLEAALAPARGMSLRRADVAALYRAARYVPLAVPAADFRPEKLDGSAVFSYFRYDPETTRFRYVSPWQRWPDS